MNAARRYAHDLRTRVEALQEAVGRIEARQTADVVPGDLQAAEFKVWSQWGEDGIIEHLVRKVPIARPIFVEFGVESYTEANTRFLLCNRAWSGLVMDGSPESVAAIRGSELYWRYNLKAEAAFITRENINALISGQGVIGDIGLLSVDIDGNDFWVWEELSCVSPRIVVAEYNAVFGPRAVVSVPYDPAFYRSSAHSSNLYWGCSMAALELLGAKKGYSLVGGNRNGNNAFFVRNDVLGRIPVVKGSDAYRPSSFRESRAPDGLLTYLNARAALEEISAMPLVDVSTGATLKVRDIGADTFWDSVG